MSIILKSMYNNTSSKFQLQIVYNIKCNGILKNGFLRKQNHHQQQQKKRVRESKEGDNE